MHVDRAGIPMTSRTDADVVVIGAGPAGSTAARLLARWGHDVALVARSPARNGLAESLPPSCVRLLDRVGLSDSVDAAGFLRSTGNTVRWGGGAERVEAFPDGAIGYQVGRDRFDAVLLDEAVRAGVRVTAGVTARLSAGRDADGRLEVRCSTSGTPTVVRAPWVLDCTGRRGAATPGAQRAGDPGPRTLALVGVWESHGWDLPDPTHTLVESHQGGWAWSVPETLGRRFVTVMMDPAVTPLGEKGQVERQYDAQLARAEWMRARITLRARRVGRAWGCDATPWCAREVVGDGVLRVGDAASFVDPLSSYGIKKALASAWLAAVVVNTARADPAMAGPATELYEERERAMYHALSRQSATLAGTAGDEHADRFWETRMDTGDASLGAPVDPALDPRIAERVRAAFTDLKRRDQVVLRPSAALAYVPRPVVDGRHVVLRDHLLGSGLSEPIRYLRNVDLVHLVRVAPDHRDVGALYDAYARSARAIPFPDFLAALTTLIGTGALTIE